MTPEPAPGGMDAMRAVVLVEGESDRVALTTLAARRGRDLDAEGVQVVAMNGITNTYAYAVRYAPEATLAGLYDAAEEGHLRTALARAGVSADTFFGCEPDLEYELIRALGAEAVEAVIEAAGETRSLALLAAMPAQQGWSRAQVLHRFLGVRAGRKARYARMLVEACDLDAVPSPLAGVLAVI
ncbi:MAG TPA: TOPRIM nucleotidyl transferase/hydrolase domain-containing protein [Sporichthya sp.]|nr:TOPRIM nucleotidyl transferase/hydrolase domain-containing protein [Sporichthya sp.]